MGSDKAAFGPCRICWAACSVPKAKRRGLAEARLLTDWARVIGPEIAARCQPVSLTRDGLLHLDVSGSAALELQHNELQVIERINTFSEERRSRAFDCAKPLTSAARWPDGRTLHRPELSADDQATIHEAVESVSDANLRQALEALGGTLHRQRLARRR